MGVAGVAGNGQTALAEAVAGVAPLAEGDVLLDGISVARRPDGPLRPPAVGYVPPAPRENAVAEHLALLDNLDLRDIASDGARPPRARRMGAARARLCAFDVRPPDPAARASALSGGNLQKLVLARELGEPRAALVLAYPTMGLDFAATAGVHARMLTAAAQGAAVLWLSEELDELMALAHRVLVLREGRAAAVLPNDGALDRARVGALMTGGVA